MLASYGVALAALRTLSMRMIVLTIVAANVILMLGPPFQLTDMGNYLGYARLGGLHGLNPYTHVIGQEMHDPIYHFATWNNLHSPYGELFTALSYPLAFLPIPVAYWIVKVVTVLLSLTLIGIVCWCAKRLGRDPRYAAVLVGLNPIYLIYAVGGFHNDFFMLVPLTASIAFLLARRDKSAGAMLVVAVAVKFSAVLLLPFLLVAARPARRRLQVIYGCVLAGIPLLVMSLILFGFSIPNLSQQGSLLTPFSFPNLFGVLDRGRRRYLGRAATRGRRARGRGRAAAPPRRGLALARRLGDVRADREPRVGDAVVRDLAAAAGRARVEPAAAARGARADRVPRARVPPLVGEVLEPDQLQPAERVGGPGIVVAPGEAIDHTRPRRWRRCRGTSSRSNVEPHRRRRETIPQPREASTVLATIK